MAGWQAVVGGVAWMGTTPHGERDRERETETDRQTDRERETDKYRKRQTDKQTDRIRQTDREGERENTCFVLSLPFLYCRVQVKAGKSPTVKTTRHQAVCMTEGSALSLVQHRQREVNTHSLWTSIPVLAVTL